MTRLGNEAEERLFPPLQKMDTERARAFLAERKEGSFTLLDVRQPHEYEQLHIPGARLLPLPELIDGFRELDPGKPTIVYCSAGGRSRIAAQFLAGHGFQEVYSMEGGLNAWEGLDAAGPRELNLDLVQADETPAAMLTIAYALEEGARIFYETARAKTTDQQVAELLGKLADVEQKHKQRLLELLVHHKLPDTKTLDAVPLEASGLMEGGFAIAAFMEQNEQFLRTIPGVIELAIMLEAQALDLYLRFADKITVEATKEILFQIAQEEKSHLALLGRLLEEKR